MVAGQNSYDFLSQILDWVKMIFTQNYTIQNCGIIKILQQQVKLMGFHKTLNLAAAI